MKIIPIFIFVIGIVSFVLIAIGEKYSQIGYALLGIPAGWGVGDAFKKLIEKDQK